ncbi:CLUMA_CG017350, isoform A [Clunio marinus]|uniref:CLUMA_CG017350, isoform A n=1 Tax=Clunio marinus TaxID=568069 RepID=A0A1J1IVW9_9DIPT|nr:CLUMA_CG017350, isoform A [Clunio marinus]
MKKVIAVLILSFSVVILIFAKQYHTTIDPHLLEKSQLRQSDNNDVLDDEDTQLFWFTQISDLHISKFKDQSRIRDFKRFCSEVTDVIKPRVMIASGDLTDGKDKIFGSQQYEEEWKAYYSTIFNSGVPRKTNWLDLRGNHDNFNVQFLFSQTDLFHNFSVQGRKHKRSYLHQEEVDGIKYNFVGLDGSIEPGTKRPYNFFGKVSNEEFDKIEMMMNESPANYTIWFAHYPTPSITGPMGSNDIRKFIGKFDTSTIYIAGHFHTMGGFGHRLYTLQPEGFLELELADFMKQRMYRVGVFDHGLFSFIDVKLGTWPIAIITNPKDVLFNNPFKEDIKLQRESSHVRIVAFSKVDIVKCKIKINDGEWMECYKRNDNFFTVPWRPSNYLHGKHKIEVLVGDSDGRIFQREQFFALDGSRTEFNYFANMVLTSDMTTLFQTGFFIAFLICLLPLVIFKTWQLLIKYQKVKRPKISSIYWRSFIHKYLVFASIDEIFYPILFWLIYTAIGPWSFHEVLDGHIGIYFVWGTFIKGVFVPGTLNWWYGFHQLMFFQLPLMIIIAGVLIRMFERFLLNYQGSTAGMSDDFIHPFYRNLPFFALLTVEILLAVFYFIQNGFLAFLIAPIRVWGLLLTIYLFYRANWRIPDESFKQSVLICTPEAKLSTS